MRIRIPWLSLACLFVLFNVIEASLVPRSSSAMTFCKCTCFGTNTTILPLYLPKDPEHPCLSCTRQFCIDQKLPACLGAKTVEGDLDTGDGSGGDVEVRCFQRDSPKTHFLVVLFLVVTFGLLVGAVLKQHVDLQSVWKQRGVRGVVTEIVSLGQSMFRRGNARVNFRRQYANVDNDQ